MINDEKRTNMQSLHGKICVALYEQLGDMVLPIIKKTYGEYGRELGSGLKKKLNPENFSAALTSFANICSNNGFPTTILADGKTLQVEGGKCPFGLENTHREMCEAMMEMDLEMIKALTGMEGIGLCIDKTVAAGDPICKVTIKLHSPEGQHEEDKVDV